MWESLKQHKVTAAEPGHQPRVLRRDLLSCGIFSQLLHVAMNVYFTMQRDAYSFASQTVRDLLAVVARTRSRWVVFGTLYALLLAAFGYGVWQSARENRSLRVVGGVLIGNGVLSLAWPPMHQRAVLAAGGGTLTDTMHIIWAIMTVL